MRVLGAAVLEAGVWCGGCSGGGLVSPRKGVLQLGCRFWDRYSIWQNLTNIFWMLFGDAMATLSPACLFLDGWIWRSQPPPNASFTQF
jgi:hypothetical protein